MPVMDNQKSWFILWKKERGPYDCDLLWNLFEEALSIDGIKEETFNQVLQLKQIKNNITMGLYWIAPEKYINLDQKNRNYLAFLCIQISDKQNHSNYLKDIELIKSKIEKPFYVFSHEAHLFSIKLASPFNNIFKNGVEAYKAFDLLEDIFKKLNITVPSDLRIAFNFRYSDKALHFDFCNWLIIGFHGYKMRDPGFLIPLLEKKTDSSNAELYSPFSQKTDEEKINLYHIGTNSFQSIPGDNFRVFTETLDRVNHRFSSNIRSPYRSEITVQIAEVVLNEKKREGLFRKGFEPSNANVWIFQCNPNLFNLVGFLQSSNTSKEISWRVTRFDEKIHIGDKVYLWQAGDDAGIYAVATVLSEPDIIEPKQDDMDFVLSQDLLEKNIVRVNLKIDEILDPYLNKETILNSDILRNLSVIKNPQGTNFEVTPEQEREIELLINPPPIDPKLIDLWQDKKNIILYGPPGTSKTYNTEKYYEELLGRSFHDFPEDDLEATLKQHIEFITFHPSYQYEHFIEGLTIGGLEEGKPTDTVHYELKPGIFKNLCKRALGKLIGLSYEEVSSKSWKEVYQAYENYISSDQSINIDNTLPFILIIDEINRGDISKIFGELITLIEPSKRIGEESFLPSKLPISNDEFGVPPNLFIIGTMNTADRSIALIDVALRRRFGFISMMPDYGIIEKNILDHKAELEDGLEELLNKSVEALHTINTRICSNKALGRDKQIGHTYLLGIKTKQQLFHAWRYSIYPLLEEYCYSNFEQICSILFDKDESTDYIDKNTGMKDDFVLMAFLKEINKKKE